MIIINTKPWALPLVSCNIKDILLMVGFNEYISGSYYTAG